MAIRCGVYEIITDSHILQHQILGNSGNSAMSQEQKSQLKTSEWRRVGNFGCDHTELMGSSKGQGAASTCVDAA